MSETNKVAAILGNSRLVQAGLADVSRVRERSRRRRLFRSILAIGSLEALDVGKRIGLAPGAVVLHVFAIEPIDVGHGVGP